MLAEHSWDEAFAPQMSITRDCAGSTIRHGAPWRSLKALALDGLDRAVKRGAAGRGAGGGAALGGSGARRAALRLLGTLRREEGHDLLREAALIAERSSARLEHAKALVALGSALRRAGQRSQSREPLRRGLELAARCGASPLAERARTELLGAGGRPAATRLAAPSR